MIATDESLLSQFQGQCVVLDVDAPFVYVGMLVESREGYLLLEDADAHDLRDTATTREKYVVDCAEHGVRPNRKQVYVDRRRVIGISRLEDVITS